MKKIVLKLTAFITLPLFLVGCVLTEEIVKIDYSKQSVPQEGGIRFTAYTNENEKVMGPHIFINSKGALNWYAAPLLAVSPNDSLIAFLAESNSYTNLYLKEIAGGTKKIQRTFNKNIMDMSFSPDGKEIAFTEKKGADYNINIINATQGVAIRQVAASHAAELGPIYAADGESIFFAGSEGSRYYVWNVSLKTTLKTQYSEGFTPVLTNDGKHLIVTRNGKDTDFGEIWSIDLINGTETTLLSDPKKGFSSPSISPSGNHIALVGVSPATETTPQNLDIYLMKSDGTQLTQLTFHGGHDTSPIWSNDGKSLFFISQRGNIEGKLNVWKMNVNL